MAAPEFVPLNEPAPPLVPVWELVEIDESEEVYRTSIFGIKVEAIVTRVENGTLYIDQLKPEYDLTKRQLIGPLCLSLSVLLQADREIPPPVIDLDGEPIQ